MPKLRPATRAARRQHILDAARRCFIERGFTATTIQHICAAAGVSAGAVYTWFASKHAIVEALSDAALAADTQLIAGLGALSADPDAAGRALAARAEALFETPAARADAQLDLQLWAAGVGDAELGARCRASVDAVTEAMTRIAAGAQQAGRLSSALEAGGVGALLTAVALGLEVQGALGMPRPAGLGAAIERLLGRGWSAREGEAS